MNAKTFSDALGKIDDKYITKAINYQPHRKSRSWVKWGAMAACLCLVVVGALLVPTLLGEQTVETPMGQGFFNAVVLEIEDNTVIVECTESLQSKIPVGSKVQISTKTVSSEVVPKMNIGDNIRVLYIGKTQDEDMLVLKDTISIFLLDENGEPIVEPTE